MRLINFALPAALFAFTACTQAAAPAATAATSCQLRIDADFPVAYIAGRIPIITVKIKGQNIRLMVDTGSAASFLSSAVYNRLQLDQTFRPQGYAATGLGGNVNISAFALVDMNFGTVHLRDEIVAILAKSMRDETGLNAIDGVMGYDILQSFDIGLDLPHNRITFYTPQHCLINETPWQGDYAPMPFTLLQAASPVITETIDGKIFNVAIDTGAYHSLIMQASLIRNGVAPEVAPVTLKGFGLGAGDLKFQITKAQFQSLGIGAEVFSDAWLVLDITPEADFNQIDDGVLGDDYLATHRVFIVNSTDTAYLGLSGE